MLRVLISWSKSEKLDDQLAEAHLPHACLQCWVYHNYGEAEKEFRRSIELNPNFALSYQAYALFLTAMGRFEQALAEIGKAQEADPLSLIISATEAFILYNARRYDEAIEKARKTLELDDRFHPAWERVGEAYAQLGMYDQAVDAFQKAGALSARSPLPLAGLGATYALSGKTAEAEQIAEELRGKAGREYALAWVYAGLGNTEQGLGCLESAYSERDCSLVYLKVDPRFSAFRMNQRFQLLLERLGLTAEPCP
jgi:tetratricopeptide (TPR) repeat protein